MGISKSLMSGLGRSIVGRASSSAEGSSRIQDMISTGAKFFSSPGAGPQDQSMLSSFFQSKVLDAARNSITSSLADAIKGKDVSSILDAVVEFALGVLKKATSALEALQSKREAPALASAGSDLKSLIEKGSSIEPVGIFPMKPGVAGHAKPLAFDSQAFAAWDKEERSSRDAFAHTSAQLKQKESLLRLMRTDERLTPGSHAAEKFQQVERDVERARELHTESIDRRVALAESGKDFGETALSRLKDIPIPENYIGKDWNRPYVGADWNRPVQDSEIDFQADGPSR